jgi:hypothetical protein
MMNALENLGPAENVKKACPDGIPEPTGWGAVLARWGGPFFAAVDAYPSNG